MSRVGRRKIFLFGLSGMASCLLAMGFCAVAVDHGHKGALWGQAAFLLLWVGIYGLTIGAYSRLIQELTFTRTRRVHCCFRVFVHSAPLQDGRTRTSHL